MRELDVAPSSLRVTRYRSEFIGHRCNYKRVYDKQRDKKEKKEEVKRVI